MKLFASFDIPYVSEAIFSLFHSLFFLLWLDEFYFHVFNLLIISSVSSSLLLSPSSEFFSATIMFTLLFFFGTLLCFLSLSWSSYFVHPLFSTSVNIFMTIILSSLLDESLPLLHQGVFLGFILFFHLEFIFFLFRFPWYSAMVSVD